LFLAPLAAVAGAPVIGDFLQHKKYMVGILVSALAIALIAYLGDYQSVWHTYLPVFILVILRYFLPASSGKWNWTFGLLFIGVLMVEPVNMMLYARSSGYKEQKELIHAYFVESNNKSLVVTNKVQKRLGEYYLGFDSSAATRFVSYNETTDFDLGKGEKMYLLLCDYSRYLSGQDYNDLPLFAKKIPRTFRLLHEQKGLKLYSIEGDMNFRMTRPVYSSLNDFEKDYANWYNDKTAVVPFLAYSGHNANKIASQGFSSTFRIEMDSLELDSINNDIFVTATVWCYFEGKADAKLVISIEREGQKPDLWEAVKISRYVTISRVWKKAFIERALPDKIDKNAVLKIYVWNTGYNELFIDDFQVTIREF